MARQAVFKIIWKVFVKGRKKARVTGAAFLKKDFMRAHMLGGGGGGLSLGGFGNSGGS